MIRCNAFVLLSFFFAHCTTTAFNEDIFNNDTRVHKHHVDMQTVESMCRLIYQQTVDAEFTPDLIIGLSRGGLIPLCYLASETMFNNRTVKTIGITSYDDNGVRSELKFVIPMFDQELEYLKQYKSILIVDDLVDSGKTIHFIVSLLKKNLPDATIKTATLFYKENKLFKPDFYVEETADWLVFPWESY